MRYTIEYFDAVHGDLRVDSRLTFRELDECIGCIAIWRWLWGKNTDIYGVCQWNAYDN